MQRKRIYIIEFGYHKFYFESRDKAYEAWEALIDSGAKELASHTHYPKEGDTQNFYYAKDIDIDLVSKMIYLHESEIKAQQSMDTYIQAEKMGIIKARKKKKKKT